MPHGKQPSESYQNLGGINAKASPYLTGPLEFLDLKNFDFQTPGSLSQRWGSTQYIGMAQSFQFGGVYEYNKLNGFSQIIFTGGSYAYNISGTSFQVLRSSYQIGYSFVVGQSVTSQYNQILKPSNYSFVSFVDQMFAANGQNFWRYDGSTTYVYGLPMPFTFNSAGINAKTPGSSGVSGSSGGMSGNFYYSVAYLNNRGYIGPSSASLGFAGEAEGFAENTPTPAGFVNIRAQGATQLQIGLSSAVTNLNWYGHGITAMVFYRVSAPVPDQAGVSTFAFLQMTPRQIVGYIPFGSGYTNTFVDNNNILGDFDSDALQHNAIEYRGLQAGFVGRVGETFVPKYLEIYNNQLMQSGFSNLLSSVFWSDIGEPERVAPDSFFEVRTNDGDRITGMKSYLSRLFIFKLKSVHVLSGQDPDNFQLNEVTNQYGCVSNRAIAIYNDSLVFLDRKGVMRFNGASLENISDKIEPIITRMNFSAAQENATAIHDKQRNQVIFGIPVDGSTENNMTLVYDYLVNAWTTYDGYHPSQFVVAQGRLSSDAVMFSDYSGLIHNFGASLPSDNGIGFSAYLKTRFLHEMGESVEKQWRRLFVNVDPIVGSTVSLNINFFKNFGSTVQISRTMYASSFQSRTDFGISGKSLAFELSKYDNSTIFKFHGFAVAYRYQRSV